MKQLLLLFLVAPFLVFGQWTQVGSDIDGDAAGEFFGQAVSISGDGSILAIGTQGSVTNGTDAGYVRIYENNGGVWTQIGSDIVGEAAGDGAGTSISLSSDGSIIAIGAGGNDGNGTDAGHVRVFENNGGVWTQVGSDIDGEAAGDILRSVSLSSDGSIVAAGAVLNDGNGDGSGHVRVFENIAGVWTQIGSDIDGEATSDGSASALSLSGDGTVVAIGAFQNDGNGTDSGHVRVFENIAGVWTQIGSDIDGEAAGDFLGANTGVSLNEDGGILALGAVANDGIGMNFGHVRIFENLSGVWTQIGSDIEGEASGDSFGVAVSLNSDGSIVAIGANQNDGNGDNSGNVRIFKNVGGVWTQFGSAIEGEAAGDNSGVSVSLNSDGSIVAIGAFFNDANGANSGHARVFDRGLLSITSNDFGPTFRVFPNPTYGSTNFKFADYYQEIRVSVFDQLGKEMLYKTYNNTDKVVIDTQQFSPGVYLVNVEAKTRKSIFKLIVN